eukprot:9399248-Karenia_brevis.AAC.1
MSVERAAWRQRLGDSYEEFSRDMDLTLEQYTAQMDSATNNTRHEIIDLLVNIARVVHEHDDRLDRMRSIA